MTIYGRIFLDSQLSEKNYTIINYDALNLYALFKDTSTNNLYKGFIDNLGNFKISNIPDGSYKLLDIYTIFNEKPTPIYYDKAVWYEK